MTPWEILEQFGLPVALVIAFGYFIWNDFLTLKGFAGLSLILTASFFTLFREYKLNIKV